MLWELRVGGEVRKKTRGLGTRRAPGEASAASAARADGTSYDRNMKRARLLGGSAKGTELCLSQLSSNRWYPIRGASLEENLELSRLLRNIHFCFKFLELFVKLVTKEKRRF